MRIVVLLGSVLDPAGIAVNRRVGRIFVNQETYLVQPADRCALEVALRLKDGRDAEVVALPRGPLPDDDVLRLALATGVDRAIFLTGDGAETADEAIMAHLLAAAVERLGEVDLVLAGATTLDTGQAQLGGRLAEALGWPQIVEGWEVRLDDGRVEVVRRDEDGYGIYEAGLPAVVTVVAGALKPRYPDGVRLINVYRDQGQIAEALVSWDVADLVGEAEKRGPLVESRGRDFPPQRELSRRLTGEVDEVAQAAAEALRRRNSQVH